MHSITASLTVTLAALLVASLGKTIVDSDNNLARKNRMEKRSVADSPWKTLILRDLQSKSYSQSWTTGGDTPSGLTSYEYSATYSQTDAPQITVTTTNKKGEEKVFTYDYPLTESWFRERFGKRASIPKDVKILDEGQRSQDAERGTPEKKKQPIVDVLVPMLSLNIREFWENIATGAVPDLIEEGQEIYFTLPPRDEMLQTTTRPNRRTDWYLTYPPRHEMLHTTIPPDCPPGRSVCPLPSYLSEQVLIRFTNLVKGDIGAGTQVHFECKDPNVGELYGPNVLTCDENGTWGRRPPYCVVREFAEQGCGRIGNVKQTIFDGKTASNADPWMMWLEIGRPGNSTLCGASLIHRQWVLTAAHCLFKKGRGVALFIQPKLYNSDIQNSVERVYIHENYEEGSLDFDVALIKLMHPIHIHGMVPVCLPPPGLCVEPGDIGVAFGRGLVNFAELPTTLQKANLTVVTNNTCISAMKTESTLTDNMFCTAPTEGLSSICPGDSGGPMVFRQGPDEPWTQKGIISWTLGETCNTTELHYSGMVKISRVLSWIRRYVP